MGGPLTVIRVEEGEVNKEWAAHTKLNKNIAVYIHSVLPFSLLKKFNCIGEVFCVLQDVGGYTSGFASCTLYLKLLLF